MARERLRETVLSDGLPASAVDREAKVIRGVALLGRTSKNRRRYSDKAMADAARLYEGVGVGIDHRTKPAAPDLSLLESPGVIRGVKVTDGGEKVRGDFHYLEAHPASALFLERAERMPDTFGFSHDAEGETRPDRGETLVESLERVRSLDLVLKPATNSSLFESEDEPMPGKTTKPRTLKVKDILEAAPAGAAKDALARLLEMDAAVADSPLAMPEEVPAGDADGETKEALKQLVGAVIAKYVAGDLDKAGALKQIKAALGVVEDEAPAPPAPEGEMTESVKTLTSRLALIEAENREMKAKTLLLESGRDATPARVKALARCEGEKDRKELLESWEPKAARKADDDGIGRRAFRTGSILESEDGAADDGDGYAAALPGGKPAWERAGAAKAK